MNDVLPQFENIADEHLKEVSDERRRLRSVRRAAAINIVNMARDHGGNAEEPYSQNDADVIMLIVELLDRVAGA